mmetsp:Transcript_7980/g.21897  ORF Transcript_7980/g.21897 Transcript_7980/m.21897 type:complete len:325 (+) Transcript_7980:2-976(+)
MTSAPSTPRCQHVTPGAALPRWRPRRRPPGARASAVQRSASSPAPLRAKLYRGRRAERRHRPVRGHLWCAGRAGWRCGDGAHAHGLCRALAARRARHEPRCCGKHGYWRVRELRLPRPGGLVSCLRHRSLRLPLSHRGRTGDECIERCHAQAPHGLLHDGRRAPRASQGVHRRRASRCGRWRCGGRRDPRQWCVGAFNLATRAVWRHGYRLWCALGHVWRWRREHRHAHARVCYGSPAPGGAGHDTGLHGHPFRSWCARALAHGECGGSCPPWPSRGHGTGRLRRGPTRHERTPGGAALVLLRLFRRARCEICLQAVTPLTTSL